MIDAEKANFMIAHLFRLLGQIAAATTWRRQARLG